jgi:quercetin dioxygenase-like cupin family protein
LILTVIREIKTQQRNDEFTCDTICRMRARLGLLSILLLPMLLHAQTEVDITSEPSHHQIFENAYVRIFKVEIPAHAATLLHRHHHDYFFVALAPATISSEVPGKPPGTLKIQQGEVRFTEGNFAHVAKNLSDQSFPHVTVEYLKDAEAHKNPPPKWDEERALHVHMNGTQDVLFVKDGIRVSDFQLQPGGMVHNQHHPGPRLIVAVSDVDIRSSVSGKSATIQLKSGEVKWLPGVTTDMLMNAGKNPARWITLEFH